MISLTLLQFQSAMLRSPLIVSDSHSIKTVAAPRWDLGGLAPLLCAKIDFLVRSNSTRKC